MTPAERAIKLHFGSVDKVKMTGVKKLIADKKITTTLGNQMIRLAIAYRKTPAGDKPMPKPDKKKETPKAKPPTKTWQKYAEKYKPFTSKGEWDKVLGLEWKRKSISPTKVVWVGTLKGGVRVETILEWKTNSRDSEEYKTINGKRITGRPDFADRLNKMVDDIESKEKMSKMMKPSDIVNIVKNA